MTNAVVYSAIYGDYEATAKQLPADLPCPAVMFTDNQKIAEQAPRAGWIVHFEDAVYRTFDVDPANGDPAIVAPMLAHKWWKTHSNYALSVIGTRVEMDRPRVSIWLDGNMALKVGGATFVDACLTALGDDDWSVMRHPWRSCIYDEAEYTATVCAYRYDAAAIRRQIVAYELPPWSHPRGWGLPASGFMVRRRNQLVADAGEGWWQHNLRFSHQDQISLPVVLREFSRPEVLDHRPLRFNYNLPWAQHWDLLPHGA